MKLKLRILLFVFIGVVLILTGCNGNDKDVIDSIEDGKGILKVKVNWENIDNNLSPLNIHKSNNNDIAPTDIGIRLVYPNKDAVYMEKTTRKDNNEENLISLEVPETDDAILQIVSVYHAPDWKDPSYVLGVAKVNNINIDNKAITELNIEDINLISPNNIWEFEGELADKLNNNKEIKLSAGQAYKFKWKWIEGDPLLNGDYINNLSRFSGNFGKLDAETGSWLDYGSSISREGIWTVDIPDHEAGTENIMGFIIWIRGSDFGLATRSYLLLSTTRDLSLDNSKTKWKFIYE